MTSKLDTSFFYERLDYRTRYGDPFFISPISFAKRFFNPTGNTFYGTYNEYTFELTNNSFYRTPFVIDGNYIKNSNGETEIEYTVRPCSFRLFLVHTISTILFLLYFPQIIFLPGTIHFFWSVFVMVIIFARYLKIYQKKKEIEKDFNEIFEITN